ncbi:MAG: FAD-dependent oxidoreductase [Candidatus Hydrogenedentes bacterium]|nr:FAD-dependent oxidoreductase [Candidatus Hydrogenedentota bacterium]
MRHPSAFERLIVALGFVLPAAAASADASAGSDEGEIWIEAESFHTLGGWVIDQQSMAQMGSAYIMAHGMGVPVADAQTVFAVPQAGEWTVWARTRDWTAPWGRGKPGGTFQVVVNGRALPEILGTNGGAWAWQKAGTATLDKGEAAVALHDLTGFNGRCEALYLTFDPNAAPENEPGKLAELRRRVAKIACTDDPEVYDLAVAGGGVSGICTAIAAIRTGSKVVLIQDRPVLGGNNSSEIRVPMGGLVHQPPYRQLGNVVDEISPITGGPGIRPAEFYEDARKENVFRTCPPDRYRLVLNTRVIAVEKDPDDPTKIAAYIARDVMTGQETRFRAKLFADCTGDAVIARMMDAEVMYGRESRDTFGESLAPVEGDNQVMGQSVMWRSEKAEEPTPFPDIDWGIEFNEDRAYYVRSGDWEWEAGQYRNQAEETEYIRDYGLMTIFANWAYLKNRSARKAEWAHDTLSWVSFLGGKRESYRVVGDLILTQNDIEGNVPYPDATGSITWNLDLHFPDPEHAKKFEEPFRSCAYHRNILKAYPVPYRCLYAKDVKNLFLAGRHISASHVAFGAVRVMRTLGLLGEVVGMAATICAKEDIYPRDIYESRLDALKAMMEKGVPPPRTYHPGGFGSKYEGYHFKDTGHLSVYPNRNEKLDDPGVQERVKALGLQHME